GRSPPAPRSAARTRLGGSARCLRRRSSRRAAADGDKVSGELGRPCRVREQDGVAPRDLELTEPSPPAEDDEHREARLERARADPLGAEEGVRDWVLSPVERPEVERLESGVEVEPAVEAERAPLEQHREV